MPEISRFHGIIVYIYFEMSVQHHEPHFHVSYAEYDASFSIRPAALLAGSLPRRQLKSVLTWAILHQDELMENWKLAIEGRVLRRIQGL